MLDVTSRIMKRQDWREESYLIVPLFLIGALGNGLYHWGSIRFGQEAIHGDANAVWRPLARNVLEGTPLYIEPAVHNKPPFFSLLNILMEMTDHYAAAFILVISLTSAATAVLIWQFCKLRGVAQVGLVAGGLFIVALPLVNGYNITVRSWACAGIMIALVRKNPIIKGAAIAAGGLFSQYAIFAIPGVIYQYMQDTNQTTPDSRWMFRFIGAGIIVVASGYLLVGLIWGTESLVAGVETSFLISNHVSGASAASPLADVRGWGKRLMYISQQLLFLLIPGVVTVGALVRRNWEQTTLPTIRLSIVLCVLMLLPLLNRSYYTYWMYSLPFLSILAAFGYRRLLL